ncbi:MAG: hypothetical protein ACFFG0_01160 [Candidatus Thorarchaeota archaeon]
MKTIKDLIGTRKGEKALIIAAGSTVKYFREDIWKFIEREAPFTIGINNITDFFIPNYHLWTNTKRFRTFGKGIHKKSRLLLSYGIHLKTVKEVVDKREYTVINFTDMKEGIPIGYKKGKIYGFYRTAGNLSIMIAHLMGAVEINIVGMDGHTFYDYEDVKSGKKPHHCYAENYEPFPEDICIKKDQITNKVLKSLREYGIKFQIITPTKYEEFYDSTRLHI